MWEAHAKQPELKGCEFLPPTYKLQLQEEARGLQNLHQEKILPQQNLVVRLDAQGAGDLERRCREGTWKRKGDAVTPPSYPALPLTSPDLSFTG